MRKSVVRAAVAAAGLLTVAGFASAAQADNYNITGWSLPNKVNGTIHAPSVPGEGAQIGAIQFTGTDTTTNTNVTLSVFCIDVADILSTGTFQGFDVTTTAADAATIGLLGYTPASLDNVGYLLNQFAASATTANKSAGLQLAIWEVLNENAANSWNVKVGDFNVTNYDVDLSVAGGVDDIANGYLGQLSTALAAQGGIPAYSMTILQPLNPANNQTQVLALVGVVPPPQDIGPGVPEPATWAMIVVGFGLLGSALRRRKPEELFA